MAVPLQPSHTVRATIRATGLFDQIRASRKDGQWGARFKGGVI